MIIVDFNQVTIANIMAAIGKHTNVDLEEDLVRHMVLNTIRRLRTKFKHEYGEIVIASDAKSSWRKEAFPYYKAARRAARKASDFDWKTFFNILDNLLAELDQHFPYRVVRVDTAEADDVIATLVTRCEGKHIIISADKDFIQLHSENVSQYDPIRDRMIKGDKVDFLLEHILIGDRVDGIPNVWSDDRCFVEGRRQSPARQKRVEEALVKVRMSGRVGDDDIDRNIARNRMLIDLSQIPQALSDEIFDKYDQQEDVSRKGLRKYFINHRLTNLFDHLPEF